MQAGVEHVDHHHALVRLRLRYLDGHVAGWVIEGADYGGVHRETSRVVREIASECLAASAWGTRMWELGPLSRPDARGRRDVHAGIADSRSDRVAQRSVKH